MLRLPAYAQFEITDVCNLRCKHCYHFDTEQMPQSEDLDDDQTIKVVEKLIDAQIYSLTITGGEPLCRFDLTSKVVQIAKKAGLFVSVNSNLLLLKNTMIDYFLAYGLDSFLVSCPATDPDVYRLVTRCGNYFYFKDKLILLIKSGISCLVNMVVTQNNFHLVRRTARDLAKMGVKRFSATPAGLNVEYPDIQNLLTFQQTNVLLEDLRWCSEELGLSVDMLVPLPKCFLPTWCWEGEYAFMRRACQAGRTSVIVSNIGEVRPCPHNPISYGNILNESLEKIWEKMAVYRDVGNGVVPLVCRHCPSLPSCNGSCRTNSLATTGRLDQPERFTVGHIPSKKKSKEIAINEDSLITVGGLLKWRKELNGRYSICLSHKPSNFMIINEELFKFISWLKNSSKVGIKDLVNTTSKGASYQALMEILKTLAGRGFIVVEDGLKGGCENVEDI